MYLSTLYKINNTDDYRERAYIDEKSGSISPYSIFHVLQITLTQLVKLKKNLVVFKTLAIAADKLI
jgi:hypothetical protein